MRFTEENKRQSKCAVNTRSKYAVREGLNKKINQIFH